MAVAYYRYSVPLHSTSFHSGDTPRLPQHHSPAVKTRAKPGVPAMHYRVNASSALPPKPHFYTRRRQSRIKHTNRSRILFGAKTGVILAETSASPLSSMTACASCRASNSTRSVAKVLTQKEADPPVPPGPIIFKITLNTSTSSLITSIIFTTP